MNNFFLHPMGLCESDSIGDRTTIWAFAHVLPGAVIGTDCNVCDQVFIENDVLVGDRVTIKSGVQLWDGVTLGDDVFVGPNATFTNDKFPRSKQHLGEYPRIVVGAGASIGANATILPGTTIGASAMVGAGAVVTKDVPPFAIVTGNPARIVGYTGSDGRRMPTTPREQGATVGIGEQASRLIAFDGASDMRGDLMVVSLEKGLPFVPQRFFAVYGVPSEDVRGEHAHRRCEQVLVCLSGSVRAVVDDGTSRQEFLLDDPRVGLYMPAMTWGTQYRYSPEAVMGVFASLPYDEGDYLRTYDEFIAELKKA